MDGLSKETPGGISGNAGMMNAAVNAGDAEGKSRLSSRQNFMIELIYYRPRGSSQEIPGGIS